MFVGQFNYLVTAAIMSISEEMIWFSFHSVAGNVIRFAFCKLSTVGTKYIRPPAKHLSGISSFRKTLISAPEFLIVFYLSSPNIKVYYRQ